MTFSQIIVQNLGENLAGLSIRLSVDKFVYIPYGIDSTSKRGERNTANSKVARA